VKHNVTWPNAEAHYDIQGPFLGLPTFTANFIQDFSVERWKSKIATLYISYCKETVLEVGGNTQKAFDE